ncbi:MAG: hypothetical protein DRQ60_02795 [Gammaproteobacteria bacterium]|nr:MAG: hypothetical protein DRQ54_01000 [Gammaproteobacteria bacterium]RLA15754.1 MAG: hypothetical protein DRQ52_01040 [Gammaproteobacteria bacterium]RLA17132.1 MAG: hypothetical protein DRQ60_02795 [Gammaproteobacteria bacterium]
MSLLLDAIQKAEQRESKRNLHARTITPVDSIEETSPATLETTLNTDVDFSIDLRLLDDSIESPTPKPPTFNRQPGKAPTHSAANKDSDSSQKLELGLVPAPSADKNAVDLNFDSGEELHAEPTPEPLSELPSSLTPLIPDLAPTNSPTNRQTQQPTGQTPPPVGNEPALTTGLPAEEAPSGQLKPPLPSAAPDTSSATTPVQTKRRTATLANIALLLLLGVSGVGIFYYFASQNDAFSTRLATTISIPDVFNDTDQIIAAITPPPVSEEQLDITPDDSSLAAEIAAPASKKTVSASTPVDRLKTRDRQIAPTVGLPIKIPAHNDPNNPDDRLNPGFQQPQLTQKLTIRRTVPADYTALKAAAKNALQQKDLQQAEGLYQQWLSQQEQSVGARFGLAQVASLRGDASSARSLYLDILQLEPKNPAAQASLLNLPGLASDESLRRLQGLIDLHPDNGYLNYVMGNHQAGLGRWTNAQQRYFGAYSADDENAVYAYNLAIALDHINQPAAAADFYRRALGLTTQALAGQTRQQAQNRLKQLTAPKGSR